MADALSTLNESLSRPLSEPLAIPQGHARFVITMGMYWLVGAIGVSQ
jgi:hypothetical protein